MIQSIQRLLAERFASVLAEVTGLPPERIDAAVRPSGDARFGDYQCNAAMGLARELGLKPRELAERIRTAGDAVLAGIADPLEVAGPGFVNVRLLPEFLAGSLAGIPSAPPAGQIDRLGVPATGSPVTVVIDYSSPNIAKQMHVGHLRTTVIGDALVRVLAFAGHTVKRQNHVGDWGAQFGVVTLALWHVYMAQRRGEPSYIHQMLEALTREGAGPERGLIEAIRARQLEDLDSDPGGRAFTNWLTAAEFDLTVLEEAYRFVTALEKTAAPLNLTIRVPDPHPGDPSAVPFHLLSRYVTMMLQRGSSRDEPERRAWERSRKITLEYCDAMYRRLGVLLTIDDVCGESFYNDRLAGTISELQRRLPPLPQGQRPVRMHAELREDQGALCIFIYEADGQPRYRTPEGDPLPMIVRKSDGAYLYATTDLAAIRYRICELGGQRLLYVVGSPQKLHLAMLFDVARAAGWAGEDVRIEHVTFGQVLGEDRKLLRTRTGGAVRLADLLDEAERRAAAVLSEKLADEDEAYRAAISAAEQRLIAQRVGIAAVKYFDLARERNADYVFSYDQMLSLKGNTAPYMMFAYASIRSIFRKAAERFGSPDVYAAGVTLRLDAPAERALGLRLARFGDVVAAVAEDLLPHVLCTYLYDLATDFMRFYNECPVLQAPDEATRLSRMRLCDLTARTLKVGLGLLGIEVLERM